MIELHFGPRSPELIAEYRFGKDPSVVMGVIHSTALRGRMTGSGSGCTATAPPSVIRPIGGPRHVVLTRPTPHQAPPRFAKRPRLQFPHSQSAPHRRRCNAGRSGFCAYSAFGSKLARSLPLSPRRKERPRHRSKQPQGSYCGDQCCSRQTLHREQGSINPAGTMAGQRGARHSIGKIDRVNGAGGVGNNFIASGNSRRCAHPSSPVKAGA
jgi:hypothetical protein